MSAYNCVGLASCLALISSVALKPYSLLVEGVRDCDGSWNPECRGRYRDGVLIISALSLALVNLIAYLDRYEDKHPTCSLCYVLIDLCRKGSIMTGDCQQKSKLN